MAGSTYQSGYDNLVKKHFRGFDELEKRKDASIKLLKLYQYMNPMDAAPNWSDLQKGEFSFSFFSLEFIMSQYVFLDQLDIEKKIMLI